MELTDIPGYTDRAANIPFPFLIFPGISGQFRFRKIENAQNIGNRTVLLLYDGFFRSARK